MKNKTEGEMAADALIFLVSIVVLALAIWKAKP